MRKNTNLWPEFVTSIQTTQEYYIYLLKPFLTQSLSSLVNFKYRTINVSIIILIEISYLFLD